MATQKSVTVTNAISVFPKLPNNKITPDDIHDHIILSDLDRQCPYLMYLVFFYKQSPKNLESVFSCLKSGLEETLCLFYPAAGRLSLNSDDGKLNLCCNNKGAILVEAITDVKISDLGDLSHYSQFFERLVHKPVFSGDFSDMPLVVAQATRFECGGYSIGIGTSHSLFDGPSAYSFLHAWASNSSIVNSHEQRQITEKPVHERDALLVATNNFNTQKQNLIRAAAIDHLYQLILQSQGGDVYHELIGTSKINDYVFKTYHLSGAIIENLKRKLSAETSSREHSSFSCSSFEVITAHLWKARTKALQISKERKVCLQFAVDARNKLVPPLPKSFTGNAYVLASVSLTVTELEQSSHLDIIEKIREAKNSINNDYVYSYMDSLNGPNHQGSSLPPLKELTIVSDWTRIPFHKVDFLGNVVDYVSPLVSPVPQVAYLLKSPVDVRGVDMRIGLFSQEVDAFSSCFFKKLQ